MKLPLDQAIPRFQDNEERMDIFANGNSTAQYTSSGGSVVPSVQKFLSDKDTEINVGATSILTQATTQANNASANAATATTQAGIATTKANEASASASLADAAKVATETARDQAVAAYDSFDDRYLGPKATAPTVDNDSSPLVQGALYFNTSPIGSGGGMKVWNGTAWIDAYGSITSGVSSFNGRTGAVMLSAFDVDTALSNTKLSVAQDRVALSNLNTDNTAYLLEQGREGHFKWVSGNLISKISSDSRQGLYISSSSDPTGSSGAWVRVMDSSNVYKGEWWGLDSYTGDSAQTIINPILRNLLPKGSHFVLPVCDITVSDEIRILQEGIHFYGAGQNSSIIRMKTGVQKVVITAERPGIHIHDLGIYGAFSTVSAGAPFAVMVSPEYSMMREYYKADVTDCHVYNNYIQSTACVIFLSVHDGVSNWYETNRGTCFNNKLVSQYQAISLFLCGNIDVYHNDVTLNYDHEHSAWFNVRMVGAYECTVRDNVLRGPGQQYAGIYGIAQVPASYGVLGRRRGYNCKIHNNTLYNYNIALAAIEWDDTVSFMGNRCFNDVGSTEVQSIAFFSYPDGSVVNGLTQSGGHLICSDNYFEGFANGFRFGGVTRSIEFMGNTIIGNNNSAAEGTCFAIQSYFLTSVKYAKINNNSFIMKQNAIYSPVEITGTKTGEHYWVFDNLLPERDPALQTRPIFGTTGSGTMHTTPIDAAGTLASASPQPGNNIRHSFGMYGFLNS